MKPYDKNTRTLLKLTSKANGLLDQINLTEYENADNSEEECNYEVNNHTLGLTFNEIENWDTRFKVTSHVYGPRQIMI